MTRTRASAWRRALEWPERRAGAALLVLVVLFTLGAAVAVRAPVERSIFEPDAGVQVHAELPGFDAVTVEKRVTEPLEGLLGPLPGLRTLVARSRGGWAQLTLQFGSIARRDSAIEEVRRRVAGSGAYLPAGMDLPRVVAAGRGGHPAVVYAITAERLSEDTARWVRNILADPLRELAEVAAITLEGLDQHEILIQPDTRRLAGLGLGFDDIILAVRRGEQAPLRRSMRDLAVSPGGPEAMAARAVQLPGGEPIALAEVTRVSVVPRAASAPLRQDGAPALRLTVYARSPQEAAHVAERTRAHLAWLHANDVVPHDVVIHSLHDEARATREWRRRTAYHVGVAVGGAMVIVFAVFGIRASGRVAAALAVWVAVSTAALRGLGFTLNSATAAGLLVALAPYVVQSVSPLAPAGFLLIAVAAGAALAISQALVGAPASAAVAVSLMFGVCIRWLLRAWLPPPSGAVMALLARAGPEKGRPVPALAATAMAALLLLVGAAVVASAFYAGSTGAHTGTFRFHVHGEDHRQLQAFIGSVLPSLHAIARVQNIASSADMGETWRLHLDEERLREAGIEAAEAGRALAVATEGLIVGEVVSAERTLPLRLQLAPGAAGESFQRLLLRGERDQRRPIYLRDVGFVERVVEPKERLRVNGRPAAEITAQWAGAEAREGLERFCGRIAVPRGVTSDCVVLNSRN